MFFFSLAMLFISMLRPHISYLHIYSLCTLSFNYIGETFLIVSFFFLKLLPYYRYPYVYFIFVVFLNILHIDVWISSSSLSIFIFFITLHLNVTFVICLLFFIFLLADFHLRSFSISCNSSNDTDIRKMSGIRRRFEYSPFRCILMPSL